VRLLIETVNESSEGCRVLTRHAHATLVSVLLHDFEFDDPVAGRAVFDLCNLSENGGQLSNFWIFHDGHLGPTRCRGWPGCISRWLFAMKQLKHSFGPGPVAVVHGCDASSDDAVGAPRAA
jgi:hypothetical protein